MAGGKLDVFLARLFFGGLLAAVTWVGIDGQAKDPFPTGAKGHVNRITHDERMRRMQKLQNESGWDIRKMYGDQAAADLAAWELKQKK